MSVSKYLDPEHGDYEQLTNPADYEQATHVTHGSRPGSANVDHLSKVKLRDERGYEYWKFEGKFGAGGVYRTALHMIREVYRDSDVDEFWKPR